MIAGRKTGGKISGQITINGAPKNDAHFRRIMGYCEQLDVHSPHTTVVEALQFSAQLRLPARYKIVRCRNVVQLLKLICITYSTAWTTRQGMRSCSTS